MKKVSSRKLKKAKDFILFIILFACFLILTNNIQEHMSKDIKNTKYDGLGQQELESKNGYSTIFTTNDVNSKKQYLEYKQGGNSPWAKNSYWGGTMEENGCGITSISIILSGYGKKVTPEDLRKIYYPHLNGEDISKELNNTFGIKCTDFYFSSAYFSKYKIIEHLKLNKPILICVWNKPDKRWTEKSHYMVLLATDGENKVYISNPNNENSKTDSGWYNIKDIQPYIAKALFIEE